MTKGFFFYILVKLTPNQEERKRTTKHNNTERSWLPLHIPLGNSSSSKCNLSYLYPQNQRKKSHSGKLTCISKYWQQFGTIYGHFFFNPEHGNADKLNYSNVTGAAINQPQQTNNIITFRLFCLSILSLFLGASWTSKSSVGSFVLFFWFLLFPCKLPWDGGWGKLTWKII